MAAPQSLTYRDIKSEVGCLKRALIPDQVFTDPLYVLSDDERRRVVAFSVLSHAEIEHLIKIRSCEVCNAGIAAFRNTERLNQVCLSLCLSVDNKIRFMIDRRLKNSMRSPSLDLWLAQDIVKKNIESAESAYKTKLDGSHGLRKHNLKTFLEPIGISLESLDPLWISEIDQFGRYRGDRAHQARSVCSVKRSLNAKDEVQTVYSVLKGVLRLDNYFRSIIRSL